MHQDELTFNYLNQHWQKCLENEQLDVVCFSEAKGDTFRHHVDYFSSKIAADCFCFHLNNQSANSPLYPFIDIIQALTEQYMVSPEELVEAADIYPLQRSLFVEYLYGRPPSRHEPILLDEIEHELGQLYDSVARILAWFANQRPIVIAISHLQLAQSSVLQMLIKALSSDVKGKMLMVLGFDSLAQPEQEDADFVWDQWLTMLHESGNLIELPALPPIHRSKKWSRGNPLHRQSISALIQIVESLASFLNNREALELADRINEHIVERDLQVNRNQQSRLINAQGNAYYYLEEYDEAISSYERVLELGQESNFTLLTTKAYRKLAWCYIGKNNIEMAKLFSEQAQQHASQLNDQRETTLSLYTYFLVHQRAKQSLSQNLRIKLRMQLNELNLQNLRAYFLRNQYLLLDRHQPQNNDDQIKSNNDALTIAKSLRNGLAVASTFYSRSIILSQQNEDRLAKIALLTSHRLMLRLGDQKNAIPIIKMLGHYHSQHDRFDKALDYYNQGYQLVEKMRNFQEISQIINNKAWIYFLIEDYDNAILLLQKGIQLIRIRHSEQQISKHTALMYVLKGVCHYKQQNIMLTQQSLDFASQYTNRKNDNFGFFLDILEALVAINHKNYGLAHEKFERCHQYMLTANMELPQLEPFLVAEHAQLFKLEGNQDQALSMLDQQKEKLSHLPITSQRLQSIIDGNEFVSPKLMTSTINQPYLIELAKRDNRIDKLQNRLREVKLIHQLQTLAHRNGSAKELVKEYLKLMTAHLLCEAGLFFRLTEGKWELEVKTGFANFKQLEPWISRLSLQSPGILYANDIEDAAPFEALVSVPVNNRNQDPGLLMMVSHNAHNYRLQSTDLIGLMGNQLGILLERMEKEAQLLKMAVTDSLTGLYNRQALFEEIEKEIAKMRRRSKSYQFTVAYLDLDNFKYYNDKFGHNVGDEILITFSNQLRTLSRRSDFVARIGGDEFVILIPESDIDGTMPLANRIISSFEDKNYYNKNISSELQTNIEVEDQALLGCSIGLAHFNGKKGLTPQDILDMTDEAMYRAKEKGKNQVSL